MSEIIWANPDISSNLDKNEYNPDDLARIEKDHLIEKQVLMDVKVAEVKDAIKSGLGDLNKEISWMTSREISLFIDKELETSLDFLKSVLKNIPEEIRNNLIESATKTSEYLKSRAMDWNLDSKEVDEIIELQYEDMQNIMNRMLKR